MTLAALELVTLRGEAPLELGHHLVHRGEVLDRPGREGAVELVQGALGREA